MRGYLDTVEQHDVGSVEVVRMGGRLTFLMADAIGVIQPRDVGKQIYHVNGAIQVENPVSGPPSCWRVPSRSIHQSTLSAQLEPCANAAVPASEIAKLALPANHEVRTPDATGNGAPLTLAVARSKGTARSVPVASVYTIWPLGT